MIFCTNEEEKNIELVARPALPRVDIVGDHGELVLTFLPVLDDEIKDWATSVSKGFQVDGNESLVDRHQPGGNGNVRNASEGPGIKHPGLVTNSILLC